MSHMVPLKQLHFQPWAVKTKQKSGGWFISKTRISGRVGGSSLVAFSARVTAVCGLSRGKMLSEREMSYRKDPVEAQTAASAWKKNMKILWLFKRRCCEWMCNKINICITITITLCGLPESVFTSLQFPWFWRAMWSISGLSICRYRQTDRSFLRIALALKCMRGRTDIQTSHLWCHRGHWDISGSNPLCSSDSSRLERVS